VVHCIASEGRGVECRMRFLGLIDAACLMRNGDGRWNLSSFSVLQLEKEDRLGKW